MIQGFPTSVSVVCNRATSAIWASVVFASLGTLSVVQHLEKLD